jgi:D-sedoheptulose 7-phosphate isomerase
MSAMALTTNSSSVTAIANDYGYDAIFQRQVEAFGRPGDVLIGLTTSGNSTNILNALDAAEQIGVLTIGMTGAGGGQMAARCKYCLRVPSNNTAHVQEVHITIGHIICGLIEQAISA